MSNKRYNQILFLTTLSVYLGLVLAGGASPVLAQAAMAKGFELKTELEAKDDLDKKPKDDELRELAKDDESFLEDVEDFIIDLKKLHQIDKFDSSYDTFQIDRVLSSPCNQSGCGVLHSTEKVFDNDRWLSPALVDFQYSLEGFVHLSDCLPSTESEKSDAKNSHLKASYDKTLLSISLSLEKASSERAKYVAENYLKAREIFVADDNDIIVKILHQNTKISFENNQIFIVTTLPRAGLDSLLAAK